MTLTTCTEGTCTAEFFLNTARQFPTLCMDHSATAARQVNGWTPENSVD